MYRGAAVPALVGTYLFGDLCTGGIFRLNANQPQPWSKQMELAYFPIQISSFGEDAAGELYVADIENGTIYRIVDASLP